MPVLDQAREHVLRQYGDDIGQRREELITPALVLDVDAAQRNIDHMAGELKQLAKATIRPHYKTHKSPDLARRQLQAGAGGLSMATVWEAAVLAGAGMDDLFVVNTVAHPAKLRTARRAGQGPPDPGRGGRGGERRGAFGGGRRGGVDARDHGRGRYRDGPLRGGYRAGMPGPGQAGDGPARAAFRGNHGLRRALLADTRQRPAARTPARGDDVLHGGRRPAGVKRHPLPDPLGRRDCHLEVDGGLSRPHRDPGRHVRGHGQLPRPDGARLRALAHDPGDASSAGRAAR